MRLFKYVGIPMGIVAVGLLVASLMAIYTADAGRYEVQVASESLDAVEGAVLTSDGAPHWVLQLTPESLSAIRECGLESVEVEMVRVDQ